MDERLVGPLGQPLGRAVKSKLKRLTPAQNGVEKFEGRAARRKAGRMSWLSRHQRHIGA